MQLRRGARALLKWGLLLLVLLLVDHPAQPTPRHRAEALEAGGIRWRVLRGGRGDTTLVLLHGYGEHLLAWRDVFDRLAAHYHVVALDLPGFGATGKPDAPYTLEAMAARVQAFLERWTDGPVILIGHSLGGAIAAELALDHPQRIVALVLIAPSGLAAGLGDISTDVGGMGRRAIGWWEAARVFVTPLHDPQWMAEPEPLASYDPSTDPAYRAATSRILRDFNFEGIGDRFRDIRQPVLVLWGRFDPVIPFETADRLMALLPCAHLDTLATMHRPQAERPDTVATLLLGFLARPSCR